MKMRMLYRGTVVMDIDGVLADFEGEVCRIFGSVNRHLYKLEDRYPENFAKDIQIFVKSPESYSDLSPIFGGMVTLNQFKQRGYYVLLLTSRPKSLRDVTKRWLKRYNVHYNDLQFSTNKIESLKDFSYMKPSIPVQYIIDDSAEVLDTVSRKLGIVSLAWEQPWNAGWYPRIRYNQEAMRVEGTKDGISWYGVWEKVGKDE